MEDAVVRLIQSEKDLREYLEKDGGLPVKI